MIILYLQFENKFLNWLCVEDDISAGCYLMANKLENEGDIIRSLDYYKLSCQKGYEKACVSGLNLAKGASEEHQKFFSSKIKKVEEIKY